MDEMVILSLLPWFLFFSIAAIEILVVADLYRMIKNFGNCPTCGRSIPNKDKVCRFCDTERPSNLIDAQCPLCGKDYRIYSSQQGRVIPCPNCRKSIKVERLTQQYAETEAPTRLEINDQFTVQCFLCRQNFAVESFQQGTIVQCPHCKKNVRAIREQ